MSKQLPAIPASPYDVFPQGVPDKLIKVLNDCLYSLSGTINTYPERYIKISNTEISSRYRGFVPSLEIVKLYTQYGWTVEYSDNEYKFYPGIK